MLSSFCGFRLSTAGVVIGWLGTIESLLITFFLAIVIADRLKQPDLDLEATKYAAVITINVISLIGSILLILGTLKERHLLLVPCLINYGVWLVLGVICNIYVLFRGISGSVNFRFIAPTLFGSAIVLVILFYIWYTIYSLYKEIQAKRDVQQRSIPETSFSNPIYSKI